MHDIGVTTRVLVEGESDQIALETLAARRGRDLLAEGVEIVAMGGATVIGRHLRAAERRPDLHLVGLCDVGEVGAFRRTMARMELDFPVFVCDLDLEDELIRALGPDAVEAVIAGQGELASFRRFQKQPAKRHIAIGAQLRRFLGTHSGRKARYARALVEALPLDAVPVPLVGVLGAV